LITTAENKSELIAGLKQHKDFVVLATHTGPAVVVAKEVAKFGSKVASVTIIETK
jgi:hypothetical protein